MSIALMTAAFRVDLPTTPKFVLVALCDSANDQGECYPSVTALMAKCSLSDRGVQKALAQLQSGGFMRRELRPGRSTVYWLTPAAGQAANVDSTPEPRSPLSRTTFTPEPGSPPNHVHPTPERRSPPPPNHVHPTPERRSPITVIEPSREPSGNQREKRGQPQGVQKPDDVEEGTWADWCSLRRAKRAPVSSTVLTGAREEAEKAGLTLERFLRVWCTRGSQGLQADWLKPNERGADGPHSTSRVLPANRQEALEQRNRAVGERWAARMATEGQPEIDDAAA